MATPNPQDETEQDEPLSLADLLEFAEISTADVESAAEWWDEHASSDWVGALDSMPIKGNEK